MNSGKIYKVYCSTCNKIQKRKMSWGRYLRYMTLDRKSKGYHEIDSSYGIIGKPTKCPFGHKVDVDRIKTIEYLEYNETRIGN